MDGAASPWTVRTPMAVPRAAGARQIARLPASDIARRAGIVDPSAARTSGMWIVRAFEMARPTIGARLIVRISPDRMAGVARTADHARRLAEAVTMITRITAHSAPPAAPHSRPRWSSTRSRSVGEEAMTRSTSAVAVCCSCASVSLARRAASRCAAWRSPLRAARSSRRRQPSRAPRPQDRQAANVLLAGHSDEVVPG